MYNGQKMDKTLKEQRKKRTNLRIAIAFFLCIAALFVFFRFDVIAQIRGNFTNKAIKTVSTGSSDIAKNNSNVSSSAKDEVKNGSTTNNNQSTSSSDSQSTSTSTSTSSTQNSTIKAAEVSFTEASRPLWIRVDIATQRVYVYDAKNRIVKNFICSTGIDSDPTVKGTFYVQERGDKFISDKYQEGAYYYVQFHGNYLFHSVPFDPSSEQIEEKEAQKLGTKASHGCVRLSLDDSKWIFDNITKGTKVVIR